MRIIPGLIVLVMLGGVGPVQAACAWVLWERVETDVDYTDGRPSTRSREWEPPSAYPTHEECIVMQERFWARRVGQFEECPRPAGCAGREVVKIPSWYVGATEGPTKAKPFRSSLRRVSNCLPDTIDPRT